MITATEPKNSFAALFGNSKVGSRRRPWLRELRQAALARSWNVAASSTRVGDWRLTNVSAWSARHSGRLRPATCRHRRHYVLFAVGCGRRANDSRERPVRAGPLGIVGRKRRPLRQPGERAAPVAAATKTILAPPRPTTWIAASWRREHRIYGGWGLRPVPRRHIMSGAAHCAHQCAGRGGEHGPPAYARARG